MAETNPDSNTSRTSKQTLNVWCPASSGRILLQQFHKSVQACLNETHNQSYADLQLVDWRSDAPQEEQSSSTSAKIQTDLPTLIIIDESSDLAAYLKTSAHIDIAQCELVNITELDTTIVKFRLERLLKTHVGRRSQIQPTSDAEVILQTVMNYSNDWLVVKDLDNRFKYVSGKFCRAYNKSAAEIVGKDDLQLGTPPELVFGKPGAEWKGYWALDKEVTDSGIPLSSPPLLLDEDLNMYESMDKVPLRNSNGDVFALMVCVYRFIQKPADKKPANDTFDDDGKSTSLWDRKKSLPNNPALFSINNEKIKAEKLKHQSDRAFIAKNRFIASASHDLRQPLYALGLYVSALQPSVNKDGQSLVQKIEGCVNALNELLTSLLDISKLDAKVVSADTTNFKIGSLLQSLQAECLSIARGKSLDIYCRADDSLVHSDEVLLRRVVRNLLVNAIKYTEQGKITMTATRIGNQVEVVIADTGIGIPADQQNIVFEEFVKVGSKSVDKQQGLGLGLSIVKRLCEILNIGLWLESHVGSGTRISLTVPLGTRPSTENKKENDTKFRTTAKPLKAGTTEDQKLLLVIDDDTVVCEAVETVLEQSGYRVISATSPDAALAKLRESAVLPDAMIVDFRLSEKMTGLNAIEIITAALRTSIPALIVTGDTTDTGLKKITDSGYKHLHKPVDSAKLLKTVRDTLDP